MSSQSSSIDSGILTLERAALAAWPAAEALDLDGWKLRAMHGVTRRANSVWTGETLGRLVQSERIERAERFYAERNQPCIVHLSPLSPPELDSELAARGYVVDAPVSICIADLDAVLEREPLLRNAVGVSTRVESSCWDSWFELSARRGRYAAVEDHYRGLLDRIGTQALFASTEITGEPTSVALGVVDGDWLGIFGMLTLSAWRRRGLADAVLRALAHAARARGARRAYLQVEHDNLAAASLYSRLGFVESHGTHYRVLDLRSVAN
jgi:GNAT superfamily N-acetyltransferase